MSHYIKVLLLDSVGNGCPVVWYPLCGRPKSVRMETEADAINFAREVARILGIDKVYVEGHENYLLTMSWTVCPGLKAPEVPQAHPLDVIAKAAV